MEKTIDDIIEEVLHDKSSRLHKSYFNSGDPDHHRVVEWFSEIVEQHLGADGRKDFYKEIFPVIIKTTENEVTADPNDEINDFIDNFDFGGE